ncbi:hypothetical protein GBAR_LOCUS8120 [Geodia barretti]|uniref:Uncharacterized protein n=1 Tax=Geodia barretti TaxID=519541 RepID=A0AA35RJJ2_GEOBA|nr:hypothetical protein GBAR_LOCUS8120 [Geodia barretti]
MASSRNGAEYHTYNEETTQVGTLSRSTWLAQAADLPKDKEHTPPSSFNLILALIAFLTCPFLGWLSIIFAIQVSPPTPNQPQQLLSVCHSSFSLTITSCAQARTEFYHKRYNESAALCTRARGTSCYAIAIGVSLALGYGILVGAGLSLNWYD